MKNKILILPIFFTPFFIFFPVSCSTSKDKGLYINNNDFYYGTEQNKLTITDDVEKKFTKIDILNAGNGSVLDSYFTRQNKFSYILKAVPVETIHAHIVFYDKIGDTVEISNEQSSDIYIHNQADIDYFNATKTKIKNISFSLIGIAGMYSCRGTGWIVKKEVDAGQNYYYMLTNWHVKLGVDKVGGLRGWSQMKDNGTLAEYKSFKTVVDIGQSHAFFPTNYDHIASDVALYKVSFYPDTTSHSPSSLDQINAYCDENNSYISKLHNRDLNFRIDQNSSAEEEQFFIGGYPVHGKSNPAKFEFISCRYFDSAGYKGKNWVKGPNNELHELINMSHFIDDEQTKYSVANDILMQPHSCDILEGGSSGSVVFDNAGCVCGIYWGGRTIAETEAYCGNIETLGNYPNKYAPDEDFTNFSLHSTEVSKCLYEQLKTMPLQS